MQTTPLTFAAEVEQTATAWEILDRFPKWESREAVDAMYARFGRPGLDLCHEHENTMYELELGYPADFVIFH